jgi:hypothetical protein
MTIACAGGGASIGAGTGRAEARPRRIAAAIAGCFLIACLLLSGIGSPVQAAANPDAVAVIIGNNDYGNALPDVSYARRDARSMKRFVIDVLGFREGNVIEAIDASQANLTSIFGNRQDHRGRLWQYIRGDRSDVFIFYSGHGVPGLRDGRGYLLPVDADPTTPELNGYPLDLLLANVEKLEARSVTIMIDACFSGNSDGGWLVRSASPVYVKTAPVTPMKGIVMLTAAQSDQVASWDGDSRHGLFTKHVLDAASGKADAAPFGDGDGTVTLGEVKAYLDEEMTYAARRAFGRVQVASITGPLDRVIVPTIPAERPAGISGGLSGGVFSGSGSGGLSSDPNASASVASLTEPSDTPAPAHGFKVPMTMDEARGFIAMNRFDVTKAIRRYYEKTGKIWDTERIGISLQEPRELKRLVSLRFTGLVENGFDVRADYVFTTDTIENSAQGRFRLVIDETGLVVTKMWR